MSVIDFEGFGYGIFFDFWIRFREWDAINDDANGHSFFQKLLLLRKASDSFTACNCV